jgi:chromosome segregation ATPase
MNKIEHLKQLIAKEIMSITNLEAQLQKIQDQLDYHQDKVKWHKEQLKMIAPHETSH